MSKFTKSRNSCQCQSAGGGCSTGSMSLRVVPHPEQANNAQLNAHTDIQNEYAPHLHTLNTNEHMGSHHAHPVNMNARAAHNLGDVLESKGLSLRASFTPDDFTQPSVCAEIKKQALQSLFRDGVVAVDAPMDRGQFRMHSTSAGQITGMEFIPST